MNSLNIAKTCSLYTLSDGWSSKNDRVKKTTEQHVFCEVDEHRGESTQSDVIQLRLRLKLSVR